ncbi:hypothetical protein DSO57_1026291 [Entomophthora muscae]|uniref:Uncharacterized protein n=1 Tax=Entomophthora muscae TaxID=34485 RepID=A0ACC2SEP9_9FUNG|nr:hypothetical protein DSO57_1026291 [Entomophthora muscae]
MLAGRAMMQEQFGPSAQLLGIDVAMVGIGLLAVTLNVLLLRILFRERLTIDRGLMAAIGLFDIAMSGFIIYSVVMRWSGVLIQTGSAMCLVSSVLFNSATVLTPMFVAQLSMVRYLAIVRGVRMGWKSLVFCLISLLLVWVIFLWRGLTSELVLLPSGMYCTPLYWGMDISDKLFGSIILVVVIPSLIAIPFAYNRVMTHYRQIIPLSRLEGYIVQQQLRRNTTFITITVIAYFMAFIPELVHVFLTIVFDVQRTALSDGIVMTLLFSITITNALFALLLHEETRRVLLSQIHTTVISLKSIHRMLKTSPIDLS